MKITAANKSLLRTSVIFPIILLKGLIVLYPVLPNKVEYAIYQEFKWVLNHANFFILNLNGYS